MRPETPKRIARVLWWVPAVAWLSMRLAKRDPEMQRKVRENVIADWPEQELIDELERRGFTVRADVL